RFALLKEDQTMASSGRWKALVVMAPLALFGTTAADAKNRPTVDDPYGRTCFADPSTDKGAGGAISYCCYDNGCWICNSGSPLGRGNCVWDPGYRARVKGNLPAPNSRLFTPVPPTRR